MAAPLSLTELFDSEFLEALDQFLIRTRHRVRGGRPAERKASDRGTGIEFEDFRPYVAGSDIRSIDWNIYQRLGKLIVRLFEETRDLPCYVLVDRSKSMYLEDPPRIKSGLQAALAMSALALHQHDSVRILSFSDELAFNSSDFRSKKNLFQVASRLVELDELNRSSLASAVSELNTHNLKRGLLVVVSDFFDESGIEAVVDALGLVRHRMVLCQLTHEYDRNPERQADMEGDLDVVDCESDHTVTISINPGLLTRYRSIYDEFNSSIQDFATSQGVGLVRLNVAEPVLPQFEVAFEAGELLV